MFFHSIGKLLVFVLNEWLVFHVRKFWTNVGSRVNEVFIVETLTSRIFTKALKYQKE